MDTIIETKEEFSEMEVILRDGIKVPVKAKTTVTCWKSGRQDCNILILEPISTISKEEK